MKIILNFDTDNEVAFRACGLDKNKIMADMRAVISPIFEETVKKAIEYGHANNRWMYPMKDYLAYSEESKQWAKEFADKVDDAIKDLPVYIDNEPEELFRMFVYFSGRHIDVGVRDTDEYVAAVTQTETLTSSKTFERRFNSLRFLFFYADSDKVRASRGTAMPADRSQPAENKGVNKAQISGCCVHGRSPNGRGGYYGNDGCWMFEEWHKGVSSS